MVKRHNIWFSKVSLFYTLRNQTGMRPVTTFLQHHHGLHLKEVNGNPCRYDVGWWERIEWPRLCRWHCASSRFMGWHAGHNFIAGRWSKKGWLMVNVAQTKIMTVGNRSTSAKSKLEVKSCRIVKSFAIWAAPSVNMGVVKGKYWTGWDKRTLFLEGWGGFGPVRRYHCWW